MIVCIASLCSARVQRTLKELPKYPEKDGSRLSVPFEAEKGLWLVTIYESIPAWDQLMQWRFRGWKPIRFIPDLANHVEIRSALGALAFVRFRTHIFSQLSPLNGVVSHPHVFEVIPRELVTTAYCLGDSKAAIEMSKFTSGPFGVVDKGWIVANHIRYPSTRMVQGNWIVHRTVVIKEKTGWSVRPLTEKVGFRGTYKAWFGPALIVKPPNSGWQEQYDMGL